MQHDYNIGSGDSKTGLQVRQDINNALAAIKSSNSGEVAPTNPVVGMVWHNTLTNVSYKYTSTGWKAIADEDSVDDIVAPHTAEAASSASASAASAASSLAASQLATSSANFKGNWSSATTYLLGESVLYNGIYYRAVIGSTNQTPLNNPTYWAVAIPINLGNFMMSKAEFNAVAAERRANRAGSGFDEFGKYYSSTASYPIVNEGIQTGSSYINSFLMGFPEGGTTIGTSKTAYPMLSINGISHIMKFTNYSADIRNYITLPPAPTVLPYTATLTQQQIDSGVIKHADASNSGLIVNGKFDTDTSGWVSYSSSTLSIDTNRLKVLTNIDTYGGASQGFVTVIGKKYKVEFIATKGTNTTFLYRIGSLAYGGAELYTSEVTTDGYVSFEFTATTTMSYITLFVKEIDTFGYFDNIAVFPADAISRSDLCFLESWHEDVSEKDFVYPLGNVQYLGTTGDCGTTVAGAFAGSATYSLFSDTWQADSALVGKGYVWSTLSDANKKAFVANPENNCYLDGDKVIQVRYRMRVVQGWGDSWYNTAVNNGLTTVSAALLYATSQYVPPKGKQTSIAYEIGASTNGFYSGNQQYGFKSFNVFDAVNSGAASSATYGYDSQCFALPIALVHRRNQGAYHPVYNENGCAYFESTVDGVGRVWYGSGIGYNIDSISTCFTLGGNSIAGISNLNGVSNTGAIGQSSGRADGLFYDQIHEGDITDLRMSSKVPTDYNRLIDKEFNRLVAGTYRGTEGEWSIVEQFTMVADAVGTVSVGIGLLTYIQDTGAVIGAGYGASSMLIDDVVIFIKGNSKYYRCSHKAVGTNTILYTHPMYGNVTSDFTTTSSYEFLVAKRSTRTKSNTLTHTDIIGSPANYPTAWKQLGVSGTPLIVAEDGTSLLPTGTTGSDGLNNFKFSRKLNTYPLQVLKSSDGGATWTALALTTHYLVNLSLNNIAFTSGNVPLTTDLIRVTYQTHTNMAAPAVNSEVLAIGDVTSMKGYFSPLTPTLIGKIGVSVSGQYKSMHKLENALIISYNDTSSPATWGQFNTDAYTSLTTKFTHSQIPLSGTTTDRAVKAFPYLTRSNGKAYLNLIFKEMKYGSYAAPTVVTAASATYTQNMTYKVNIAGCALDGKVIQWTGATATFAADWSLYDVSPTGVIYLLSTGQINTSVRLYDGDSWGDDSKFNIVDYVSTTTDTNGATVLIGQKRVELPYFIGAAE